MELELVKPLNAVSARIELGREYFVPFIDGNVVRGEAIEVRKTASGLKEYYIHYVGYDRRLDKWIPENQIYSWQASPPHTTSFGPASFSSSTKDSSVDSALPCSSADSSTVLSEERKMTRNQLRMLIKNNGDGTAISSPPRSASSGNFVYIHKTETPSHLNSRRTVCNLARRSCDQTDGNDRITRSSTAVGRINLETGYRSDNTLNLLQRQHLQRTRVKTIDEVYFGRRQLKCWYYSPFPGNTKNMRSLYMCEFCLHYVWTKDEYLIHLKSRGIRKCPRRPPGKRIYCSPSDKIAVFQVEGAVDRRFCQNLSLVSKLFLDHKTIYFDVAPYKFYVLAAIRPSTVDSTDEQYPLMGYFSKEIKSPDANNLACNSRKRT